MSLYQRKGSPYWYYSFTIDSVRFRGSTRETSKRDAKAVVDEIKADARRKPRHTGEWKLRYVFGAYWNDRGCSRRAAKTIEGQLANLSRILGRDMPAIKLTAANLLSYRAIRREEKVSDSSINREIVILRAALGHAAKMHRQRVPELPWADLMEREPPGRTRFLTYAEFNMLREKAHQSLRPIIICAVTTGLRKDNILSLEWPAVQLERRIINVIVKGNKRHSVRITPALLAGLSTITNRTGKVFDATNFEKRWKAALKDAGIKDFRFHDLRHTFASWARQNGADIADVCEALCHSDISMTMRYAHIKPDAQDTAFDRVSDAILAQNQAQSVKKGRS